MCVYAYVSGSWHGLETQLFMMPILLFVQNHHYLLDETFLSHYLPPQTTCSRHTSGTNLE